jgi:hypothetical protein
MTKRAETKGTNTPSAIVTNGGKFVLGNPQKTTKNATVEVKPSAANFFSDGTCDKSGIGKVGGKTFASQTNATTTKTVPATCNGDG